MPTKSANAVVSPNWGLYFDRPPMALDPRALQDGRNFRVKEGKLNNLNLGWERFESGITLNGAIVLIANFFIRGGNEHLIFGTVTDLYLYNVAGHSVSFLTPRYATGTASANGTAVTGVGTAWATNAKAGDEIHFGNAAQTDPAATWYTIQTVTNDTAIVLTTSAGVIAAGVYTIRKKFTGDTKDIWDSVTFVNASPSTVDEWWATNGVDTIIRWNGTDTQVERMTGLGFTCRQLSVYSNMMIFGHITQSGQVKPTDIINSDVGKPQNAGAASTGLSSQFKVHGGSDEIMRLQPLGDNLAIYSSLTITVAQFIGDPLIFVFRHAVTEIGPLASRAVADFGDFHEFIGHDSQYLFDGATAREIGKQVWRQFIRQQDPTRAAKTFTFFDDDNGELLWILPSTVDPGSGTEASPPSRAVSEHYLEDVGDNDHPTALRDFPFTSQGFFFRQSGLTWDQLTSAWSSYNFRWNDQFFFAAFPLILVGSNDGKLYTLNTSQNADGAALPSYVKFGRRPVVDGRMRGLVTRIYPFVTQFSTPLNVTLHLYDNAQGPETASDTQSFDQNLTEGVYFTTHYRRARYMTVKVGTDGPSQPYEIAGFAWDVRKGGMR